MKGDKLYTDDCFDKFFSICEPVVVGTKRSIKEQLNHDDENLSCDLRGPKEIEVFASLEKSPLNTTDIACHSCGIIIYVPLPVGGWQEHVKGRIGIEVTGVDNFRITYIDDEDFTSPSPGYIDFMSSHKNSAWDKAIQNSSSQGSSPHFEKVIAYNS